MKLIRSQLFWASQKGAEKNQRRPFETHIRSSVMQNFGIRMGWDVWTSGFVTEGFPLLSETPSVTHAVQQHSTAQHSTMQCSTFGFQHTLVWHWLTSDQWVHLVCCWVWPVTNNKGTCFTSFWFLFRPLHCHGKTESTVQAFWIWGWLVMEWTPERDKRDRHRHSNADLSCANSLCILQSKKDLTVAHFVVSKRWKLKICFLWSLGHSTDPAPTITVEQKKRLQQVFWVNNKDKIGFL